ncbi:hypothetical protein K502DRAFT_365375 [Neoconidiobolus thromboides FSU 785]|nr:hypothetical protein K502DRAFT_365375 [Neoconidiobolus thromboides FSU 785]
MSSKFDTLPDILLEEIFKLISPIKLFEYRLLNKTLYRVINHSIEYNLTHSVYSNTYENYQQAFIKEKGSMVSHLNLNEDNIELINYCLNVRSITFVNNHTNNLEIGRLTVGLPYLKSIAILIFEDNQLCLNLFESYLLQIETFTISYYKGSIETLIGYLSPLNLKRIKLYNYYCRSIVGLDQLKVKFGNLKLLKISGYIHCVSSNSNPNINFNQDLNLVLKCNLDPDFNISSFGDLKVLKSAKLITYTSKINECNFEAIKHSNIHTLSLGESDILSKKDFTALYTLKSIYYYDKVSKDIIRLLSLMLNVTRVVFYRVDFSNDKFILNEFGLNNSKLSNSEYYKQPVNQTNLIQCKSITKIKIQFLTSSLQNLFYFLVLFPNVNKLRISDDFQILEIGEEIRDKPNKPLYFTFRDYLGYLPHNVELFYSRLNSIAMLTWFNLDTVDEGIEPYRGEEKEKTDGVFSHFFNILYQMVMQCFNQ